MPLLAPLVLAVEFVLALVLAVEFVLVLAVELDPVFVPLLPVSEASTSLARLPASSTPHAAIINQPKAAQLLRRRSKVDKWAFQALMSRAALSF